MRFFKLNEFSLFPEIYLDEIYKDYNSAPKVILVINWLGIQFRK